jgi:hypothetical protein
LFATTGCGSFDAREAGRDWQRHECLRQPSPDTQRRCEEAMKEQRHTPEMR